MIDIFAALEKNYSIKNIKYLKKLGGFSADNYLIEADALSLVLKKYSFVQQKQIKKIEQISNSLRNFNISTPIFLYTNHKSQHLKINNNFYALYPRIDGIIIHEDKLTEYHLLNTANLLAKFNKIGLNYHLKLTSSTSLILSKDKITTSVDRILKKIQLSPINKKVDDLTCNLIKLKLSLLNELGDFYSFNFFLKKNYLVHGDFHNENILFDIPHHIVSLLDFEEAHYGHYLEDVVNFLYYACFNSGFKENNFKLAASFINFYSSNHFIPNDELIFGIRFLIYKLTSTFFLEQKLYNDRDLNLVRFIKRDFRNLQNFNNFSNFTNKLLAYLNLN